MAETGLQIYCKYTRKWPSDRGGEGNEEEIEFPSNPNLRVGQEDDSREIPRYNLDIPVCWFNVLMIQVWIHFAQRPCLYNCQLDGKLEKLYAITCHIWSCRKNYLAYIVSSLQSLLLLFSLAVTRASDTWFYGFHWSLLEYSLCLHWALEQTLCTSHYISPLKYKGVGYNNGQQTTIYAAIVIIAT